MIIASSMVFIDVTVVHLALPVLQRDLGASFQALQWTVNAYSLTLGGLLLLGGAAGDRFGRRRVFAIGLALFGLASLGCALASDGWLLVLARALQGIGGALLVPGSLAIISETFPKAERGRAIGTWAAASALTTASGPMIGGWLVEHFSWRIIFEINPPLAAVSLFLLWRAGISRGQPSGRSSPLDWAGALWSVVALGSLTYACVAAGAGSGWPVAVLAALALCGGALFVRTEARAAAPLMPLDIFRSSVFTRTNIMTLLLYGALSGVFFLLPFRLINGQGYTASEAGAALLPFSLSIALLSRPMGALQDRWGPRPLLTAGAALYAGGLVFIALAGVDATYWNDLFPGLLAMGIGMSLVVAPLTTAVMNSVEEDRQGLASGINNAASRIAGLISVALVGAGAGLLMPVLLGGALDHVGLTEPLRSLLLSGADGLNPLLVPAGVDAPLAERLHSAGAEAQIGVFRLLALGLAGLATAAAVVASTLPRLADQPS